MSYMNTGARLSKNEQLAGAERAGKDGFSINKIKAICLKDWLHDGSEIALIDVREQGEYGAGHIFYTSNIPYSRLEIDIARMVPRKDVRIVVYDDGDGIAEAAAVVLGRSGYNEIYILDDGLSSWKAAGFEIFKGVNVPSKAFGELIEHEFDTPSIEPQELAEMQARGEPLVILDGRTPAEYKKMSIPGAVSCPNGELALRVGNFVTDAEATVVVNCAGRTRSFVGAQTLINLGIPNRVLALENGTQGWMLAGLQLKHGASPNDDAATKISDLSLAHSRATKLAEELGVHFVKGSLLDAWLQQSGRTTYLFDIRTEAEFASGSLPGATHAPGGQLVQATDEYVGVRGGRIVLFDSEIVRAPTVAGWLQQMGWDVYVLEDDIDTVKLALDVRAPDIGIPLLSPIDEHVLAKAYKDGAILIDLRGSMDFRSAHIKGARWSTRPRLRREEFGRDDEIVFLSPDARVASLAAMELQGTGARCVGVNTGDPKLWGSVGLPIESTPDQPADTDCIDFIFFAHGRHDGNKQASREYLKWETELISQLDSLERNAFRFSKARVKD